MQGIFAAGDVIDTEFKQAITGAGEGVAAAYQAYKYVREEFILTVGEGKKKAEEVDAKKIIEKILGKK